MKKSEKDLVCTECGLKIKNAKMEGFSCICPECGKIF
jgi:predicted RNA-binding Zn-ribbon protein involved in translation (DUF1610 family)